MNIPVGTPGQYIDTKGRVKAAVVIATHDSIEESDVLIQPQEGFVHIAIYGLIDIHQDKRADVPLKATAEGIPDYKLGDKLVGYFNPLFVPQENT